MPVFVWRPVVQVLLVVALVVSASRPQAQPLDADGLNELVRLAQAGAPQLALKRMDAEQPPAADRVAWVAWEQERLQILANQGMHAELIARVAALPEDTDAGFRAFALSLEADAHLQRDAARAARETLRRLLWSAPADTPLERLARWRQGVIRSYVLQDRSEDARLALLRYRQDFGDEDPHWRWLNAQVMVQSDRARAAMTLLADDPSPQGAWLQMRARLAVEPDRAGGIAEQAAAGAPGVDVPGLQALYWALAAQAAGEAGLRRKRIEYLEKALSLPIDRQLAHGVIDIDADTLWAAYIDEGKRIGNAEQKLLGNDEDWYFPATEAIEKDPLRARILFTVLADYGTSAQRRSVAHEYFVSLLADLPDGETLVRRLYLESGRYADVERLPQVIRYQLIDAALQRGDLDTTSALMAGLSAPPVGAERFDWDLRRARVAIFTGDAEAGFELLRALLENEQQDWPAARVDRFLQVVFDLQTVKQHELALRLFTRLFDKPLDDRQRRELLFWMADSLQGLARYDQAAHLYLKSATLLDPTAMDPWAQTARYRAAKALAEAGLLEDARGVYTMLLRATKDASRKAVLQNELQRLHLVSRAARNRD